ncbi:MAG: hypothetical protein ACYCXG_10060 [Acidiferrobacter sp.]
MDLILGLVLGTIGTAYFVYGRKQQNIVALASGIGLMVFPMMVSGTVWLLSGGLAFMALPFFVVL